jgi:hypothetical protein
MSRVPRSGASVASRDGVLLPRHRPDGWARRWLGGARMRTERPSLHSANGSAPNDGTGASGTVAPVVWLSKTAYRVAARSPVFGEDCRSRGFSDRPHLPDREHGGVSAFKDVTRNAQSAPFRQAEATPARGCCRPQRLSVRLRFSPSRAFVPRRPATAAMRSRRRIRRNRCRPRCTSSLTSAACAETRQAGAIVRLQLLRRRLRQSVRRGETRPRL